MTDYSNIRVMIVDDEPAIRRSLADYLEDFDFQVSSFGNAEEALSALKDNHFNVAVVDLRLPGITGNVFVAEAHKIIPELKYIIHTGSTSYKITADLQALGLKQKNVFLKPQQNLDTFVNTIVELANEK